jgi:hypothetical protein
LEDTPLPPLHYTGFAFACDPPLPDNHGFLEVHPVNRRILRFQDGTPFLGLGVNLAGNRRIGIGNNSLDWRQTRIDYDVIRNTIEELSDVGGNYARMFLFTNEFATEWVNLGVYDHFVAKEPCPNAFLPTVIGNSNFRVGRWTK